MKIWITVLILLIGLLIVWVIWSYLVIKNIEQPDYSIISKEKGYEIRQYDPYIVAQVEVSGNQEQALNRWFRLLAWYIFWGNTSSDAIPMTSPVINTQLPESINMTVPVIDTKNTSGMRIIQFTMPGKYTLETLPKPDNEKVVLQAIEGRKVAVVRYTGYTPEEKVEKKKNLLLEYLVRDWIPPISDVSSALYNPPLSFPFMRRNEVFVEID